MKKHFKILSLGILLIGVIFTFSKCSSDDDGGTSYFTLMGTINQPDGTAANGAIVYISSMPNAASVISKTVTDQSGGYSLMGLEKGTYYLSATFDPANTNNLKSANAVILSSKEMVVTLEGDLTKNITMEGYVSGSDVTFSLDNGWSYDNTHSTFAFEFPYDEENAVFNGIFSRAGFDVLDFDAANPENTMIKAWVDVVSVETGAPSGVCGHGRDGITGCIAGTFGVDLDAADTVDVYCEDGSLNTSFPKTELMDYDLWGDGSSTTYQKQSAIVDATGVATFESTSVEAYGNGYIATGNFSFNGFTKEVQLYFNYLEGYTNLDAGTNGRDYCSFYGMFKFSALDDYGISSGHVGGADITVKVSAQFRLDL